MAWITPKTNWAAADVPTKDDFNRIEGNLLAVTAPPIAITATIEVASLAQKDIIQFDINERNHVIIYFDNGSKVNIQVFQLGAGYRAYGTTFESIEEALYRSLIQFTEEDLNPQWQQVTKLYNVNEVAAWINLNGNICTVRVRNGDTEHAREITAYAF